MCEVLIYTTEIMSMNSVPSASDEAASSCSHDEITHTSDMERAEYIYMDSKLYKAAIDGKFEPFTQKELSLIMTPDKNTILHIHVRSQSEASAAASTTFMEQVLGKCPSLLMQVNVLGDTPLHVAAKYGRATAVEFLINSAKLENRRALDDVKEMLRKTNNKGNTPLHEAVQNCFADVVSTLTKEDPDFLYPSNNLGETLLNIAVGKGSHVGGELLIEILTNCKKLAYQCPHGRTALHAAVISGCYTYDDNILTRKIVQRMTSVANEVDEYGWTPLHYAAYYNNLKDVKLLLEVDVSAAYIGDKERKMTPLLLAASQGNLHMVKEIISQCPTCYELVDIRGWNILHYALLASLFDFQYEIILECFPLRKLIHETDDEGNTPLHLLALLSPKRFERFHMIIDSSRFNDPGYFSATNKQGFSIDAMRCGRNPPQLKEEILQLSKTVHEPYRKGVLYLPHESSKKEKQGNETERARESHLVVAALIATVSFAAAFTLPGGYIQDGSNHQGTAILKGNSAFQTFVITNGIAMILSVSAVFIHFIMSLKIFRRFVFLFWYAFWFTLLAMGAMVLAFITGAYAMLEPSLWLALVTIFIGLTFFFLVIFFFAKVIRVYLDNLFEFILSDMS